MSEQRKARGSTTGLVEDLLRKPEDSFREQLIDNAMKGMYHDYRSSHSTPKILLNHDLLRYGYQDLAKRARRGEYDDKPDNPETLDSELAALLKEHPSLAEIDRRAKAGELHPDEATRLMATEMAKLHGFSKETTAALLQETGMDEAPAPKVALHVEGLSISAASDSGAPPFTRVHVELAVVGLAAPLYMRFKSRGGVEAFCRDMMEAAEEVWPEEP